MFRVPGIQTNASDWSTAHRKKNILIVRGHFVETD